MSGYTALNKISYVSQPEFGNYTLALDKSVEKLKKHDPGFYRVAKTFMRTKDDPFQADFNSGDHFGSTPRATNSRPSWVQLDSQTGMVLLRILMELKVSDALLGYKYTMNARNTSAGQALPYQVSSRLV